MIPPTHQCCSDTHIPHHSPCPTAPLSNAHVSLRLVLSLFCFVFNFISERKSSTESGRPGQWGLDIIAGSSSSALIYALDYVRGRKQRADINKYALQETGTGTDCSSGTPTSHPAISVILTNTNHYSSGAPPRDSIKYT